MEVGSESVFDRGSASVFDICSVSVFVKGSGSPIDADSVTVIEDVCSVSLVSGCGTSCDVLRLVTFLERRPVRIRFLGRPGFLFINFVISGAFSDEADESNAREVFEFVHTNVDECDMGESILVEDKDGDEGNIFNDGVIVNVWEVGNPWKSDLDISVMSKKIKG